MFITYLCFLGIIVVLVDTKLTVIVTVIVIVIVIAMIIVFVAG